MTSRDNQELFDFLSDFVLVGAFQYAKDSGNFGWNSNGKLRFGFF